MMSPDRIRIDVPAGDERRVESEVFRQLAAIRAVDRSDAVGARRPLPWFGFAIPAAALVALAIVLGSVVGRGRGAAPVREASLVVTPVGGSSRFTVGDAVIDAGADTSVEIQQSGEGVTLVLQRGTVDCDVAPRAGRPPFRVIGGTVHVEVIGTRFAVTRIGEGARVDVTRGKVHVRAPAGERLLTPGQTWTPGESVATDANDSPRPTPAPVPAVTPVTPVTPAPPAPPVPPAPEPAPAPGPDAPPRPSTRDAFAAAQRLEATDPPRAAKAYRAIANAHDAWAALALYSLAELHAGEVATTLRELDELARRFPDAANAEDGAWLRVDVLRGAGRRDEAARAAAAYLNRFPQGTYAVSAARLAAPR